MTTPPAKPHAAPEPPVNAMTSSKPEFLWWQWLLLLVPPLLTVALVIRTMRHFNLNERYFTYSAYYVLFTMAAVYAAVLTTGRGTQVSLRQWFVENRFGIALTCAIAGVVLVSVAPGYRVLADEANLIGVSKNLFYQKTANFATTGKWYFENYWNLNQTIDRRPALFPFLVSLLHTIRGYHPENAFHVNAIIFTLFIFSAYRLGKLLSGELFGAVVAILAAAEANTLLAARSAGFDLLSSFMILIVIKSFVEYTVESTPKRLALLSLNLCVLAHVRYEGWALLVAAAGVLLVFRVGSAESSSALCSALFLHSRLSSSKVLASSSQSQGCRATHECRAVLGIELHSKHSRLLQPGIEAVRHDGNSFILVDYSGGGWNWDICLGRGPPSHRLEALLDQCPSLGLRLGRTWSRDRHCIFVFVGQIPSPSVGTAIHLVRHVPCILCGMAAHRRRTQSDALGRVPRTKFGNPAPVLTALALFAMQVPTASEARFTNALILTRQASRTWDYFSKLGNKNILIMTDRPGLYTIMDYGALDISWAQANRDPLLELSRKLYSDVYLIQEVDLSNGKPKPEFDVWSDLPMETVYEFQNTDNSTVRIARIKH